MKILYVNSVALGFSTGSKSTAQANIIHTVNVPVYVGGFVAETTTELDAIRSYVNGLSSAQATLYQNGDYTQYYNTLKAALPFLWQVPIYVRSRQGSNAGQVGAQEATEIAFPNMQQIWLPQENNTSTVVFAKNGVIANVELPNISGSGGFSLDGGLTWVGNGTNLGLIGGYGNRTNIPIFAPDMSKYYSLQITSSFSNSSNPYLHTVSISKNNSSYITTYAAAVTAMLKLYNLGDISDATGGDPYDELPTGGDAPLPGGGAVGIPGFPGLTATSAGVIGLFCPSATQMQLLADFMWTDFGGTGTTVEDILKEVVEALKRTISNPLDYIVGLNIIPSQGLSIGGSKSVRFGFVDSGVTMPLLANQYFTVDCGSLAFDTVCGDTFLDYAPYAKFSIYLPYIGFKDVDPNDFVGHSIGVIYHGDCVTGGITAYITKDGSVMYQYSGCCALNVPLSADSWGETISGAISVATGIVAAAATGGAAGVGLAAAKGAASVAANPSLLSPQVNHSGAVSGGAGCMGVQYPFVIREAVNFHSTAGFNKESGYPAYYYKALSEVTGFTTVLDPHINNIPQATQGEMSEIISLLESGVIL